jgi:hypothetical protein
MFVFAPDITIKEHPIRFGPGTWTSVTGVMTGTFTQPMPIGMATIGHWKGQTMDHERLFWDNQDFMKQLGLGKQEPENLACNGSAAGLRVNPFQKRTHDIRKSFHANRCFQCHRSGDAPRHQLGASPG